MAEIKHELTERIARNYPIQKIFLLEVLLNEYSKEDFDIAFKNISKEFELYVERVEAENKRTFLEKIKSFFKGLIYE